MVAKTSTEFRTPRVVDMTKVTLRFPALLEYRPVAIELVSALVQHVEGADRHFRNEMVTAFGEAFNNIVLHGYRNRADGMLDVEAEMSPGQMCLRLIDTGREVDFRGVEPPDLTSLPEGGMGVFMIHALVDEVLYRGGSPNVLTLTKRTTSAELAR
jgi:serine/threonine-protein kinase RsbW